MASMLDVATWLMQRYAPEARLRTKYAPAINHFLGRENGNGPIIQWYVGDGLTLLLHEIGHYVHRHTNDDATWRQQVIEEVEAWLWAEKTARRENIWFDYERAERYFNSYFHGAHRRQLVYINWRWWNGVGPPNTVRQHTGPLVADPPQCGCVGHSVRAGHRKPRTR